MHILLLPDQGKRLLALHQSHLHLQSGSALAAGIAKPLERGRWLCLLFSFIMH